MNAGNASNQSAAISLAYAKTVNIKLAARQKLIVSTTEIPPGTSQTRQLHDTNAEEADMRIWRHVCQSRATRVLTYSPDTYVLQHWLAFALRPPEIHNILYIHFNFKTAFVWELMICVGCGGPQSFVRNTKGNKNNLLWMLGIALSILLLYNGTWPVMNTSLCVAQVSC